MNCFLFFSSWSLKHWKLLRVLTYGYAKIQKFKEIEKHSVNIKIFANFLWWAWIVLNSSNKTAVEATQGQTKLPAIYREDFLWPPPPPPSLASRLWKIILFIYHLSNTWKSNVPVCAFSWSFHFIAKFNFPILNFHICRTIITQIMIKLLLKIMLIFSILVGSRAHAKIFAEF